MREIKFRVWCKYHNSFEPHDIKIGLNGEIYHKGQYSIKDHILLQFTGLHDKNGKEIYEGDIVVNWWDEKETVDEGRGFVEMRNGCFGYETKNKFFFNIHSRLKVIGNIYENPELLKEAV